MSDLPSLLSTFLPAGITLSSDLYVPRAPGFRRVWYCTNRAIHDSQALGPAGFSGELGDPTYGLCQVRISQDRSPGQMARTEWGFFTGSKKIPLIELADDYRFSSLELFLKMQQELKKMRGRQSLIFVHGYNVSFNGAIERAAQLAEDLRISGEVFAFSWPSQNKVIDYIADQDRAEKSVPDLVAWEQIILAAMGNEHGHILHVLAHSMGNRILAPALATVFNTNNARSLLGEVVLAAADADIDKMVGWLDEAVTCARRISIYASATDIALQLSQHLHKSKRVGRTPSPDLRWDTVHCDEYGDDWIKHSYIFEIPAVLADIRAALDDRPCEERHMVAQHGPRTWKLLFQ